MRLGPTEEEYNFSEDKRIPEAPKTPESERFAGRESGSELVGTKPDEKRVSCNCPIPSPTKSLKIGVFTIPVPEDNTFSWRPVGDFSIAASERNTSSAK
jgi:hypothetical protein